MPRRRYTPEFKLSVVKLVNRQGYSVADAARSLGVDASNVRGRAEQFSSTFSGADDFAPGGEETRKAEPRRLREEIGRLLLELEIST